MEKKFMRITFNGNSYDVEVEMLSGLDEASAPQAAAAPVKPQVPTAKAPVKAEQKPAAEKKQAPAGGGQVKIASPFPGTIVKVNVQAGQAVKKGEVLCVLEAMKMENDISAPQDGTVATVATAKGASVATGDLLITMN